MRELAVTIRRLAMRRTFTLTCVATLAVGIGATTAIFSTVNATLLRPLPYPRSEDVYTLNTARVDGRWSTGRVASTYFTGIAESAPSVDRVAAVVNGESVVITDEGENRQVLLHGVSDGFFDIFDVPMAAGRAFTPEEYAGAQVAIVSHRLWTETLGGDPSAIGRSLRFTTGTVTVVGVAPAELDVPAGTDVWFAIQLPPGATGHNYQGYLRVRPGTRPELLAGELATVMAGLIEEYPQAAGGRGFVVRPLVTALVGDLGPILLLVLGGAVVLLLIGSMNVATLILGRGAATTKEVAVRAALGADRWSVIRRFMLESAVLTGAGTAAGLALAFVGLRALLAFGAAQLPRLDEVPFDGRVLLFTTSLMLVTTLATGLIPAVRLSKPDIRGLLNESGRSNTRGRGTHRLLSGLVIAEVAFAIVLVAGAGWLVRSYVNLMRTDPGFDAAGRLVFTANLFGTKWAPPPVVITGPDGRPMLDPNQPPSETPRTWLNAVAERLHASGQVQAVGSANVLPLGRDWETGFYIAVPGEPYDAEHPETARTRNVGSGFFEAVGARLLAGRTFRQDEYERAPSVVVVNEAFVRRYLPGRDPLQTSFSWGFPVPNFDLEVAIVGVVEDVRYAALREPPDPTFFIPGMGPRQSVVVATTLDDPRALIPTVRAEVAAVDPSVPITVQAFDDIVSAQMVRHRIGLGLMTLFALIALALAAIGIYGVVAHVTGQRAGELATRMAFGASPSEIRALVMRQGRTLAIVGALAGLGVAYLGGGFAASRLYQVSASDPFILAAAVAAVVTITLLAFLVPALRASRRDPVNGLKAD